MQIRGMWSAGPGEDQARFLADLRALRDEAAIEDDELAARAHYPSDVLKEAENGPFLPGLPVLSAYVRACEGDVPDWEERWRRLAEVPEDPDLPVRPAGASPAAAAGARAGVSIVPPDVYDPERIRAALRGGNGRSDHNGHSPSGPGISAPARGATFSDQSPAGWGVGTSQDMDGNLGDLDAGGSQEAGPDLTAPSWDVTGDQAITMANGNRSAQHQSRGPFDAAAVEMPDSGERADQFRWLPETEPAPPPTDSEFPWSGLPDTNQADDGQKAAAPHIDAMPAAETAGSAAATRSRASSGSTTSRGSTRSMRPTGSPTAKTTSAAAGQREKDRFFPARLLVIIIIAALIGSVLVLLLN